MYMYIFVCIYSEIRPHIYIYIYIRVHVHVYVNTCTWMHIYIFLSICLFLFLFLSFCLPASCDSTAPYSKEHAHEQRASRPHSWIFVTWWRTSWDASWLIPQYHRTLIYVTWPMDTLPHSICDDPATQDVHPSSWDASWPITSTPQHIHLCDMTHGHITTPHLHIYIYTYTILVDPLLWNRSVSKETQQKIPWIPRESLRSTVAMHGW
jgi:hypothetical protein